ncbi:MAG: putative selenium-dependent hydroxylase accessory protein YqeC [Burkholderiales bacterium]|nr:putative selenium-dependent hydroxylase accessory protein YqeC [Burkholderiales bacterium]
MFALARAWVGAGERVLITTTTKIARDEAAGPWPAIAAGSAEEILEHARRLIDRRAGALIAYAGLGSAGEKLTGFAPELIDRLKSATYFDRILVEADGSARRPLKAPAAPEPVVPASSDAAIAVAGLNGLDAPLSAETVFRPEIWAQLSRDPLGAAVTADAFATVAMHPVGLTKGWPAQAQRILFLNRADTPERHTSAARILELIATAPELVFHFVAAGTLLPEPVVIRLAKLSPPP